MKRGWASGVPNGLAPTFDQCASLSSGSWRARWCILRSFFLPRPLARPSSGLRLIMTRHGCCETGVGRVEGQGLVERNAKIRTWEEPSESQARDGSCLIRRAPLLHFPQLHSFRHDSTPGAASGQLSRSRLLSKTSQVGNSRLRYIYRIEEAHSQLGTNAISNKPTKQEHQSFAGCV